MTDLYKDIGKKPDDGVDLYQELGASPDAGPDLYAELGVSPTGPKQGIGESAARSYARGAGALVSNIGSYIEQTGREKLTGPAPANAPDLSKIEDMALLAHGIEPSGGSFTQEELAPAGQAIKQAIDTRGREAHTAMLADETPQDRAARISGAKRRIDIGRRAQEFGQSVQEYWKPENYMAARSFIDNLKDEPVKASLNAIAENTPNFLASVVGSLAFRRVLGPVGSASGATATSYVMEGGDIFNDSLDAIAKKRGGLDKVTEQDYATIVSLTQEHAALNAGLDAIPVFRLLNRPAKQLFKKGVVTKLASKEGAKHIGKEGLAQLAEELATETGQEWSSIAAKEGVTGDPVSLSEFLNRTAQAQVAAGGMGLASGVAAGVDDIRAHNKEVRKTAPQVEAILDENGKPITDVEDVLSGEARGTAAKPTTGALPAPRMIVTPEGDAVPESQYQPQTREGLGLEEVARAKQGRAPIPTEPEASTVPALPPPRTVVTPEGQVGTEAQIDAARRAGEQRAADLGLNEVADTVQGRAPLPDVGQAAIEPSTREPIDLLKTIAAAGGLSREAAQADGVDPANFKEQKYRTAVFGRPLFPKRGGMGMDQLAEFLSQRGYLPEGKYQANDAVDLVHRAMRGEKIYAQEDAGAAEARAYQKHEADQREQAAGKPGDTGVEYRAGDLKNRIAAIQKARVNSVLGNDAALDWQPKQDDFGLSGYSKESPEVQDLSEVMYDGRRVLGNDAFEAFFERFSEQHADLAGDEFESSLSDAIKEAERAKTEQRPSPARQDIQGAERQPEAIQSGDGTAQSRPAAAEAAQAPQEIKPPQPAPAAAPAPTPSTPQPAATKQKPSALAGDGVSASAPNARRSEAKPEPSPQADLPAAQAMVEAAKAMTEAAKALTSAVASSKEEKTLQDNKTARKAVDSEKKTVKDIDVENRGTTTINGRGGPTVNSDFAPEVQNVSVATMTPKRGPGNEDITQKKPPEPEGDYQDWDALNDASVKEQSSALRKWAEAKGWKTRLVGASENTGSDYINITKPTEIDPVYGVVEYETAHIRIADHPNHRNTEESVTAELFINVAPGAQSLKDAVIELEHFMQDAARSPEQAGVRNGTPSAKATDNELTTTPKLADQEEKAASTKVLPESTNSVDQAAHTAATSTRNDLPQPTEAMKEAGNYKKGKINISGLDISIENPEGSERSGKDASGKPWSITMRSHYGYVARVDGETAPRGKDKDHIDVFIKPGTPEDYSGPVFVVDQVNKNGTFDEHKVMLGFADEAAARAGYLENYTKGWTGLGAIKQFTLPEFKMWLKDGNTKKPVALLGKKLTPSQSVQKPESAIDKAMRSVGLDPNAPPDKAKSLRREAEKLMAESRKMLDRIPPGQPVSSTADRNLRDRSAEKARKAGDLFAEAEKIESATAPAEKPAAKAEVAQAEETNDSIAAEHGAHDAFIDRMYKGEVTPDEIKAHFRKLVDRKDAITAQLNALTKDKLLKMLGGMAAHHYKNETKSNVVAQVYDSMLSDMNLSRGLTYTMGKGSYEAALKKAVDGITANDIKEFADKIAKQREERATTMKNMVQAVKDPKTLEDYFTFLRFHQSNGKTQQEAYMTLTPEQRAAFDDMAAEQSRNERSAMEDLRKTDVRVAATTAEGQIVETKHTKSGIDLFVVKAAERVEREVYNQWNATAKRLGGYYSSFRGAGAVPGFQFKTRENADAFLKFIGGNVEQAQEVAQARRDAFKDDRSQSAVERLNEMADRLEERADESLGQERKANTARRARFAANAEAAAESNKALAATMRNIATAIEDGKAKFLNRVRTKAQVEMLRAFVHGAQRDELRAKYPQYIDQEKHQGDKPTGETIDYAVFPRYTAYRSDLARLGRELEQIDGTKKLGSAILKVADDVTDTYLKFAKENLHLVSTFGRSDGKPAIFSSRADAEAAIKRSGYKGKAVVLPFKRNQNMIILSPTAAQEKGIWTGDPDKRITINYETGSEIVAKVKAMGSRHRVSMPYIYENVTEERARLKAMGIETPTEFRAALREFVGLRVATKAPDKVKEMERAMIGRRKDGLDFFPTPTNVVQDMIEAAGIEEGMSVLEPSAGMGHIADNLREAGFDPDVVELSGDRRELLELKGFNVIGSDFMDIKDGPDGGYDRILMNPPFSDRRDAEHVRHAYDLLKPGGRLVALMGEGVFFGQDKKAIEFREWLDDKNGTSEKLEEGAFLDPSLPVNTGTAARMVVIDKTKETDQGTALFSRSGGWSGFPDAIIAAGLGEATKHPDYAAAKAGDTDAAYRLVRDVLPDSVVEQVRTVIGDKRPVIVPVRAIEAAGHNKIPQLFAERLGKRLGLSVDTDIVQTKKVSRGGADGFHRLANQPDFAGKVEARDYLLVDDTLTQGGTFAQIKEHIESRGGRVVAAVALTGKQYSATLGIQDGTLSDLRDKYGSLESWWYDQFGYGFDGLTESEARYVLKSGLSPDAVRDRVLAARSEGGSDQGEGTDGGRGSGPLDGLLSRTFQETRPQGGFPASGLSLRDLEATVARVTKGYKNLPPILTLERPGQAPSELLEQIKSAKATGDVEGAFHNVKIYLFADNLRSEARAEHVLMEHEIGHYGLRGVFGKELDPILSHIYLTNERVRKAANERRAAHGLKSNVVAVEEVLVSMPAADLPKLKGFDRLVSFLRDWFARHGFQKLADRLNAALAKKHGEQGAADLFAAEVVTKAREWARSGKQTAATQLYMGVTRLSDIAPTFYSQMERAIDRLMAPTEPAGQLRLKVAAWVKKGEFKQEEYDWSGIDQWLSEQTGKITKERVVDFLRANNVQVQEFEKGEGGPVPTVLQEDAILDWVDDNLPDARKDAVGAITDIQDGRRAAVGDLERLGIPDNLLEPFRKFHGGEESTKFGDWQLPGGENYRELLLTFPSKETEHNWLVKRVDGSVVRPFADHASADDFVQRNRHYPGAEGMTVFPGEDRPKNAFRSSHFDEPNILAHVRFNERTDADGKRVLFIEEVQSDWHQKGRKGGYAQKQTEWEVQETGDSGDNAFRVRAKGTNETWGYYATKEAAENAVEFAKSKEAPKPSGVPDAPFKTTWPLLAMKRMIRWAAENGFDRIAWTTGEQQEQRYWGNNLIAPAVRRWGEITKPESVRELGENIFGREMAAAMPLQVVDGGVLAVLKHNQVRKAVVSLLPVDVVDILTASKLSANDLLDKPNVVFRQLPIDKRGAVAVGVVNAFRRVGANLRAKLGGLSASRGDVELLPTLPASELSPREIAGLLDPIRIFHGAASGAPEKAASARTGTEPLSGGMGSVLHGKQGAAELAGLLNAHAEIIHGREGLLQQAVEPPPGEGMKAFYDQMLPSMVNKYVKKWGGKVGTTTISTNKEFAAETDSGQRVIFTSRPEAQAWLYENGEDGQVDEIDTGGDARAVPSIDITPAMRESVMQGQPLFSRQTPATEAGAKSERDKLPTGVLAAYKARARKVIDRIDRALDPMGNLPDSKAYMTKRYLVLGRIAKGDEIAKVLGRAFGHATAADKQAVYDYLTTADAKPKAIQNELARADAVRAKGLIESVSDAMVARGMLSEEAREAHRGSYLPQLYLKWLLNDSDVKALGAGKKPSDMGYLKGRKIERTKGPDGEARFVWRDSGTPLSDAQVLDLGPISDPGFLAATAIAKPVRDMALLDFLSAISQNEKWILPNSMVEFDGKNSTPQFLKAEAERLRRQADHYDPEDAKATRSMADRMDTAANKALGALAGDFKNYREVPNTAQYGRLRGLWVRKEIYDDLVGVYDLNPKDPGFVQSLLGYGGIGTKITQLWKMSKVSLNPPAQVRNFVSNGVLLQLSGVPLHKVPVYLVKAARAIASNGPAWQTAKKYGVTESTFSTQELYRIKRDLLDLEMREGRLKPLGKLHRIGAIVADGASDAYQFSEALYKTAKIMHAMDNGSTEADAAIEAMKWLFDYSLVPKGVRYARNAPVGIPFLTFAYKVLPRLAEVAILHPQRLIPWVALFAGWPLLWAVMTGDDDDEYERLQKALPKWLQERGHAMILPYTDDEGRSQVLDLGYFMPWSMYTDALGDLSRGEIGETAQTLGIFSGPLTSVIVAMKTGKDPFTGRDIMDPGDPPGRQFAAATNYAWDMMMPPIVSSRGLVSPMGLVDAEYGGKLVSAATGRTNKFGDPTATAAQAALYPFGLNVYSIEPQHATAQNVLRLKYEADQTELALRRKLQNRGLSDEARREIVQEYADEMRRRTEKIMERTDGAQ